LVAHAHTLLRILLTGLLLAASSPGIVWCLLLEMVGREDHSWLVLRRAPHYGHGDSVDATGLRATNPSSDVWEPSLALRNALSHLSLALNTVADPHGLRMGSS